ncbi:MAG: stage II sporulation protein R [Defluviitaleaceae bacterium]|nr:stage II sporulation protein R [Defluviitaleaceae bacterium]
MKKFKIQILAYAFLIGVIITLAIAIQAFAEESTKQQRIANEIIRFHVLANSNSEYDQYVKMKVKETILEKIGYLIKDSRDIETTRNIILHNLKFIENEALNVVNQINYMPVVANLTNVYFPTITYGNMTLPKGYYESLTISIGNATGDNWWCVMFPMLCFVEGSARPTEELRETLEDVLTEREYREVFNVRFRFLDMWQARNNNNTNSNENNDIFITSVLNTNFVDIEEYYEIENVEEIEFPTVAVATDTIESRFNFFR